MRMFSRAGVTCLSIFTSKRHTSTYPHVNCLGKLTFMFTDSISYTDHSPARCVGVGWLQRLRWTRPNHYRPGI